ncbi:hypothetical protein ACTQ5K_04240 [Niallia sp. Sow4_A1]|uniref:Uncharacterized protein n=1 Tax=Niallia hominis TaxID=3133173 RepID=A0ABV1EUY2_9BACI|nr:MULTISPECIES: hypothetical protein [Bacillaceae]MCF2646917.1 hypothetical protein [Niallia circulans]MCM3360885.1 hypothetical protein [Niallia sp. MER TA 168]
MNRFCRIALKLMYVHLEGAKKFFYLVSASSSNRNSTYACLNASSITTYS